jgi:crotonobetaine/carnitine-CoA ligase
VSLLQGRGPDLGPVARRFDLEERTMLHVLRAQAQERPDKTWLVFDGAERVTFGEAQARANQAANAVHERLPDGGQVALYLRNQIEFFPAYFGAQAAGAVSVALNPELRGLLLERAIAACDARILVARADLLENLQALDGLGLVELVVVCGGDPPASIHGAETVRFEDWLAGRPTDAPRDLPKGWDAGSIAFTSGSTGGSKGAVCPHQFLYLYSAELCDSLEHSENDVLSTPLPLCHAAALHVIAGSALHVGATAHLKSRFSAGSYWREIADDGATFAILLGTMAGIILKNVPEAPEHRLANLFCVPFPPDGEEFERRYRTKILWQAFGMTEIYPHPMPRRLVEGVPYDTVGPAVAWMDHGVVDEHDRMLGPGEMGELVYRPRIPHAMVREYYKQPEATLETFRNMMFHTGDLGFYDEDGLVHYRGRKQDRIRRRGENVSAVELEFIAMSHERVVEAAAYGVPGEFGEHEVKLDVVCRGELELRELHDWLVERLPRYMVPRYLERREALPKTPSAKIEKYKLAADPLDRDAVVEFVPARRSG